MLILEILDNSKSHENLLFKVEGLTAQLYFDTYYFEQFATDNPSSNDLKLKLADLLEKWASIIEGLNENQDVYLPVDISDQYTSGLKVQKENGNISVYYGSTTVPGWSINPFDTSTYCNLKTSFTDEIGTHINVSITAFCSAIRVQIEKLKAIS